MKIVAVDFDGVINPYTKGWQGKSVFEKPSNACHQELKKLKEAGWIICINTCRSEEANLKVYLLEHKIPFDHINYSPRNDIQGLSGTKLAADVYIDDKNITFDGNWNNMAERVMAFKPFYKSTKRFMTDNDIEMLREVFEEWEALDYDEFGGGSLARDNLESVIYDILERYDKENKIIKEEDGQ